MTQEAAPSGNVRESTRMTVDALAAKIVRVSTHDEWPYQEFSVWLDDTRVRAGIKNDYELAQLAGLNHSSISAWKSGRQRPSTRSLSKLASPLKVAAQTAWRQAGYLTEADEMPAEPAEAGDWYEEMVERSRLPRKAKDQLIATRRSVLEAERRRAEEQIKLMEELQIE